MKIFIPIAFSLLVTACSNTNPYPQKKTTGECVDVKQCVKIIQTKVSREWERPSNLEGILDLVLSIQLSQSGELKSVDITESSGDYAHDESAIRALRQASPFPEIQGLHPEIYRQVFKELRLKFVLGNG